MKLLLQAVLIISVVALPTIIAYYIFRKALVIGESVIAAEAPIRIVRFASTNSADQETVGESHYQPALRAAAGPGEVRHHCTARLMLEDTNAFDLHAVRVEIEGSTIGYLPRPAAVKYRERIAGHGNIPGECDAVIAGGGTGRFLGAWLDLELD